MHNSKLKLKIALACTEIIFFSFLILTLHFLFSAQKATFLTKTFSAFADTMSNSQYIIRWGNFNMVAGKPSNASYKVSYTAGQIAPGLYQGPNYKVRSGFQYIYSIIPFAFRISETVIDFGSLDPTYPIKRTNILTVSNQSAGGYVVTGFENHPLLVAASGSSIGDTTCDNGLCTESTAGPWVGNDTSLTYGFGYRCDAVSATNYCVSDFNDADNYKQFADASKDEAPQAIFSDSSGKDQQAQITYKVNVSQTQASGRYSNVITYIATPTY